MTTPTDAPGADDATVLAAWHDAVNAGDIEAAVALCSDDVAVQGPRGVGHGHDLVRGWLTGPASAWTRRRTGRVRRPLRGPRGGRWTTADAPDGAPLEPTGAWCVFQVGTAR